jgi:nucleotide-binding universal stress UspA family protein
MAQHEIGRSVPPMSVTYIAAYDGSGASLAAVRFTVALAGIEHARVLAAHAGEALPDGPDVEGVERLVLLQGSPAEALRALALEERASLISVGVTHHGRLGRLVHGSVAAKLLSGSPCAVMAVPEGAAPAALETIGVAYDGRRESRRALLSAERLARKAGARLVLIGSWDVPLFAGPALATELDIDPAYRERFAAELEDAAARVAGIEVETRLVSGPPGPTIAAVSGDDLDLLVAGSRSYGPLRTALVGSVSRKLVDEARCPVLVVPRATSAELDAEPEPEAPPVR